MFLGNRRKIVLILCFTSMCYVSYHIGRFYINSNNIQRFYAEAPSFDEIRVEHKSMIQITPKPVTPTANKPFKYLSLKPTICTKQGMRPNCTGPNHKNLIGVNQCGNLECACYPEEIFLLPTGRINDPNFPPVNEMLPIEKETLNDEEFVEILNTASVKNSEIVLMEPLKTIRVGDSIKVKINLKDGLGRQRRTGGDDVRVWMTSFNGVYKASGHVTDLKNGTYIGTLKALWKGETTIHGAIAYTRESRASSFKWRRQYRTMIYYYGKFSNGKTQEFVICSPYSIIPGYPTLCNLTLINDNSPWFCGHPLNHVLTCEDFIMAHVFDSLQMPVSQAEMFMFNRGDTLPSLQSQVKVVITKGTKVQQNVSCNKLPIRESWDTTMPTGYFNHNEWKPVKCYNHITSRTLLSCLNNTTVIFHGDSTTRHWYEVLSQFTKCKQTTENWTKPKWYRYSVCRAEASNFTLIWAPHVFPFFEGYKTSKGEMNLKSAVSLLNELPSNGKIIFVIHHFCHFVRQHYTFYQNHIRSLKTAIRNALARNKDIKIAIKSPHVFHETYCSVALNDFPGPIFIDILQKELEEFKDSVWFLNYWDMTMSIQNVPIHPVGYVKWENLRLLFGYVCK